MIQPLRSLAPIICASALTGMTWCPAAAQENSDLEFQLLSVQTTRHCADQKTIQELEEAGVAVDTPRVKYRFLAKLSPPVIIAQKLNFTVVKPEGGDIIPEDSIEPSGHSFRGQTRYHSSDWGIKLDPGRRWLVIDLVLARDRILNLERVEGEIEMLRGKEPQTVLTGLVKDEKGFHDEKTGATVSYALRWGSDGRHIAIEFPIPRKLVAGVRVVDQHDRPIPFDKPGHYQIVGHSGSKETLVKLYLAKPKDQSFKVRLETFNESDSKTQSFTIKDVRIEPRASDRTQERAGNRQATDARQAKTPPCSNP